MNFEAIREAICFWLGYQFKIGRERLIHEASLRYPIADTITAEGTKIANIQLEKGHPCFTDRSVDVFVFDKDVIDITNNNFINSIVGIFELKIVKKGTGTEYSQENQRVIDDILRLAYFNQYTGKRAYFLICGEYQDFKNYFVGQKDLIQKDKNNKIVVEERSSDKNDNNGWNGKNSLYNNYFDFNYSFNPPSEPKLYTFRRNSISKSDSKEEIKKKHFGINSFQDRYEIKDNVIIWKDSITIKTTCISITPFESISFRTHACGIWQIEAVQ